MSASDADLYAGREQTLVKHFILERYLERFAHIIGSWAEVITYIDGFSGPWNVHSDSLADSSFYLSLQQLRKARDTHASRGKTLQIRCFFVEREKQPYKKLQAFAKGVTDAVIETRNAHFEDSIDEVLTFAQSGGAQSFPFVFIDPSGWTGFAMDRIGPLLRLKPGEVLINFMTGHIRRFIESPLEETQESFERLFGSEIHRDRISGLEKQDREDQLVRAYVEAVKREGRYNHVCPAIVLHPEMDRTHFHLIYATRSLKGVEVFKAVEKKAMAVMEKARAEAQQRKRVSTTGQQELFGSDQLHDSAHYETLRERYLNTAKASVLDLIKSKQRVLYDDAWSNALTRPLVWDSDVKGWIKEWKKRGIIRIDGMKPNELVPKLGKHHWLVWGVDEEDS